MKTALKAIGLFCNVAVILLNAAVIVLILKDWLSDDDPASEET